jgi:sigma-B regulation protein RsbU (phosphoserine phosphatase)
MKILIAEDDPVSRRLLEARLKKDGYELVVVDDGGRAWSVLRQDAAIELAILDWNMPGLTGPEICRKARETPTTQPPYLILLTSRDSREDIVSGLEAGANDYVTKPFDFDELRARIQVGERVLQLQQSLAERVSELEDALARVKALQGLLPICLYCKKIRDDQNYWQQLDRYVAEHSDAKFSHGICPDCYEKVVKPELERYFESGPGQPPDSPSS